MSNLVKFTEENSISEYMEEIRFLEKDKKKSIIVFMSVLAVIIGAGAVFIGMAFYLSTYLTDLMKIFI